ncbi:dipeptidyl-peptidase 3 family protein [Stigmatella aurantiaca]|uniref:Peptidase M49 family protein, dipeptidyl-peptidase III n=1 Tax=Stigmatella aurantiaca (strain DW4/3-1) TaxID=378806 RepID=Q08U85_STIAD|nr:peptidase [Stigmatella aurantiaca]ADO70155.1 Peptidase M49 family protein, dipeptidyl-peptidase III [Stigmatella aurantiaca DW4/3-1]EAU64038.1 putative dipeptidyl-peptidase III [Stigmatella aurantiaca DW4/3-1]
MNALLLVVALAAAPQAKAPPPAASAPLAASDFLKSRSKTTAVAQLFAPGVANLTADEKRVLWNLTLAAHAGQDIAYDQLGWRLVAVKRLLENVYLFGKEGQGGPGLFDKRLTAYLERFYGHMGNHDHVTGQKFVPEFTAGELDAAAVRAFRAGASFGVKDEVALRGWLAGLRPTIFDASFEPSLTSKSPPPGQDMVTASANTAYGPGVTRADLEEFKEKYPLNSRVVKENGKLVELVFRSGAQKIPPGLYAVELGRVVDHLEEAMKSAPKDQKAVLGKLARYFQTGNPKDWEAFNIAWVKANPRVDATLGFVETYVDPLGQKGLWEGLVNYRDPQENRVMELIGKRAQYFEERMPWPQAYKRKRVSLPVAKAIHLVATYPQPPAGINLPNEQHIREKYGSKSVLVANVMEVASALRRLPLAVEFSRTEEDRAQARKHSATARKWLVAFHEVLGHASGQVDKKLGKQPPSRFLKEYDNTLEEARADLVALWHAFDPALAELSPEHEQIAQQMYRDFLVEGLTNLQRVEKGDEFEEDHQRGHHMTVNFLIEKGVVRQTVEGGRTYWGVVDFAKMREAVGELLSKLMVIKATGDYAGIRALVTQKGIKFDPKLRDEVVARVKAADVPSVIFVTAPRLIPVLDDRRRVVDVKVESTQGFIEQNLERSLLGRLPPAEATQAAVRLASAPEALKEMYRKLLQVPGELPAVAPAVP